MTLKNFIVFEGIDGAGTTTQIRLLREKIQNLNLKKNFFFTQEPSSSPTGIFLRSMLKGDVKCTNETAAYLFAADRNEHVKGSLKTEENNLLTRSKSNHFFRASFIQVSDKKDEPQTSNYNINNYNIDRIQLFKDLPDNSKYKFDNENTDYNYLKNKEQNQNINNNVSYDYKRNLNSVSAHFGARDRYEFLEHRTALKIAEYEFKENNNAKGV